MDDRVLYVAGFGRGVYKSSDGGRTWSLKNQGITQTQPFAWRLARSSDGALYVLIARRSEDGSIGNAGDGALYVRPMAPNTGSQFRFLRARTLPMVLPSIRNRPIACTSPRGREPQGSTAMAEEFFFPKMRGKSWKQVLEKDRHIYDITIDPPDPNVLYAAGFESSAWRSADRGLTLDAHSRLQFQVGAARDSRSAGSR